MLPDGCRPREREDPYAAAVHLGKSVDGFVTIDTCGYGSLLPQGRRERIWFSNSRYDFASAPHGFARVGL